MQGYVKAWKSDKGYGFLAGQDGDDYFVHFTNIEGEGYQELLEGRDVEFDIEEVEQGRPKAVNVKMLEEGRI
ncbi:cold shock domain-containing protein [Candidatus Contubernalis alkalaceticus]|nr:cold shock domain-containing protein [Candidatus Contubernalis alkalaceticus]